MKTSFRSFYWKRWHSLAGMIPIGFFLITHLYTQSFAMSGAGAYNVRYAETMRNPWLLPIEIVFLYIPLLFHLILGLVFILKSKYNIKYNYLDNWRFILQRVSGFGLALFIGAHFTLTRGHSWFANDGWTNGVPHGGWFHHMSTHMKENLTFSVYLLGVLATAGHIGNGLWTFFNTMGWSKGVKAQQTLKLVSILFIILVVVAGMLPLYYLRTA